jgi:hypothetical protein
MKEFLNFIAISTLLGSIVILIITIIELIKLLKNK